MPQNRIDGELILDNENGEVNPNWYSRVIVGGMSIVGVAAVMKKMGGPTAKALGLVLDDEMKEYAAKQMAKWDSLPMGALNRPKDFIGTIPGPDGEELRTSEISKLVSDEDAFATLHSTDNMISASKLNRVETNIKRITKAISKSKSGSSLDNALRELQIGTNDFLNIDNKHEDYLITATKVDTLKQYLQSRGTGFENAPDIGNLFDDDLLTNFDSKSISELQELHEFYIKNDAKYLDMFDSRIAGLNHDVHKIISGKASTANEHFVELKNRQVFVPKSMGDVGQQLLEITGPIKMEDKSVRLFTSSPEKVLNDQTVSEILDKSLSNNVFTSYAERQLQTNQYRNTLKDIGVILSNLTQSNPDSIANAYIDYKSYGTSGSDAEYFEIVITKKPAPGKQVGELRIPIPMRNKNNMIPHISNTEGRKFQNINYIVGSVGTVNRHQQIDTTHALLYRLKKMLSDARMNDVLKADSEDMGHQTKRWIKDLSKFQRTGSHVEGELRDIFKSDQTRVFFNDEFATMSPTAKANAGKQWRSGAQSMLNVSRISTAKKAGLEQGKKTILIGFDLETLSLNTTDASPHFTAGERGTGVWQAGIQVLDTSNNQLLDMKELVGDHVLNEHRLGHYVKSGTLMAELQAGNPILEDFAKYAQSTMGIKGNGLEAKYKALVAFHDMVKEKAGYSNKQFGTNKFTANSDTFAKHILQQLEETAAKYASSDTQVMFVGANISGFDFRVLDTLTGGGARALQRKYDYIDITDIERNLSLGVVDRAGRNVESIFKRYATMTQTSLDPKTIDLSTKEGARAAMHFMEKSGIIRADSYMNAKNIKMGGLADAIAHNTGGTLSAHNSTLTDITPVMGVVMMMREQFGDDIYDGAKKYMEILQNQNHSDYEKAMSDYLQVMGYSSDDNVSVSAASMSLLHKKATQKMGVSHIFPFSSIDPFNRQLAQQGRTSFIRKHDKTAHHRFWTSHTTDAALEAEAMMYKEAGFDRNMFANKLNIRTLYTIGSAGRQGGFMGIGEETLGELRFMSKQKSIGLDKLPTDSRLANQLTDIQGKIYERVNQKAKARGIKNIHRRGSKIAAPLFREAIAEVMKDYDRNNVTINPNNPAHQKMYLGPNGIDIESTVEGRLSGIKLGYDPSSKKTRLLYNFAFESSDKHLSAGALNIGNIKAMPSILLSTAEERTRHSSKYGLYADYEALANVDFLDKKFAGLTKRLVFDKAVDLFNNKLANQHKYSDGEIANARKGMKKIVSHLNEVIPGGAEWVNGDGYGFVKFGINKGTSENAISAGFSKLDFGIIMDNMATMGHDAVFNKKQLLNYYGYFGGGKGESYVRKGVNVMNKLMASEITADDGSKSASIIKELKSMNDASKGMKRYLHPMQIIQEHLDADASYGFKNATDMLLRGDDKVVARNLKKMKIPTFTQIAFDEEVGGEALAFFGGTGVTPYAVNTEQRMAINHIVPIQHDYLTLAAHAPGLTKRNYRAILGSSSKNVNTTSLDLANTMNRMIDSFRNNVISEQFVKNHGLELDQIALLATNDVTKKAIDKAVDKLSPEEQQKISDSIKDDILSKAHMIETEEAIEEINAFNSKKKIDDFNKKIAGIKANHKYLHVNQVEGIKKLADLKKGIAFLPFGTSTDDLLSGSQKLEVDLQQLINSGNGKHVDVDSFIGIMRMLTEENKAMDTVQRGIKNFEIIQDYPYANAKFDKAGNLIGNMKISMAGLIMPINRNTRNIMNKMDMDVSLDGLGIATPEMAYIQETAKAYMIHYENTIKGLNPDARHLDTDAALSYFRLLGKIFPQHKDGQMFKATKMSEMPAIQGRFHSSDHLIYRTRKITDKIADGTDPMKIDRLKNFFDSKGYNPKQQEAFIDKLKMISNSDMNTVIVGSSSVFHPDQRHTIIGNDNIARQVTYNEWQQVVNDKGARVRMELAKEGLATLPGNAVRFPILPAGLNGLNTNEVLAMTDDIFEFLKADNEKVYMFQRAGDLIHADNDRDIAAVMTNLYYNIKDMNDDISDTRVAFKKALQSPDMQNFIQDFNATDEIVKQYYKGGQSMVDVSQVTPDGKIITKTTTLQSVFENKRSLINKTMGVFTDVTFARQSILHQSANLMERHMETTMLGAYSSSIIGMVTNSVRARTADIMGLNHVAGRNIVDMSLIGGTMKTGLGHMYQMSVESVKHGADAVFNMTEAANFWKDPSRATASQFNKAKEMWMDAYGATNQNGKWVSSKNYKQDFIDAQSNFMDVLYGASSLNNDLRNETPQLQTYMRNVDALRTGQSNASFMQFLHNELSDTMEVSKFNRQLTSELAPILRQRVGKLSNMMDGNFDFKAFYATLDNRVLGQEAMDPYARAMGKRFNNFMSSSMVKKSGKFAGIAALTFLGANFFRPNQLSNSSNPLDGFSAISPTSSDNTAFATNSELGRGIPLDKVDASFSKDAFIYNNDLDQATDKQNRANVISSFLDNSVFRTQTNTHHFRTKSNVTISDRRTYIGPFGSSEYNRRF